jgi:hypothetical protein
MPVTLIAYIRFTQNTSMHLKRSVILLLLIFFSSACLLVYSSHKMQVKKTVDCPVKCCGTYQKPTGESVPGRMNPRIIFPFND